MRYLFPYEPRNLPQKKESHHQPNNGQRNQCIILTIPDDIIDTIISRWFLPKDIANLDSAICSTDRTEWLHKLKSDSIVCDIVDFPNETKNLFSWMVTKEMKMLDLRCADYYDIDYSKLKLSRVTNLVTGFGYGSNVELINACVNLTSLTENKIDINSFDLSSQHEIFKQLKNLIITHPFNVYNTSLQLVTRNLVSVELCELQGNVGLNELIVNNQSLKRIKINNCGFSDDILKQLPDCPNLTYLSLTTRHDSVNKSSLIFLFRHFKNLTFCKLECTLFKLTIKKDSFIILSNLSGGDEWEFNDLPFHLTIRSVELDSVILGHAIFNWITTCEQLNMLVMKKCIFTMENMSLLNQSQIKYLLVYDMHLAVNNDILRSLLISLKKMVFFNVYNEPGQFWVNSLKLTPRINCIVCDGTDYEHGAILDIHRRDFQFLIGFSF